MSDIYPDCGISMMLNFKKIINYIIYENRSEKYGKNIAKQYMGLLRDSSRIKKTPNTCWGSMTLVINVFIICIGLIMVWVRI